MLKFFMSISATTISSSNLFSFMTTTKSPGGEVILPTVAKKLIEIPDTKVKGTVLLLTRV